MPLTLGTRLGPYEIAGPLGKGGMGEVYRAKDTKLDRDVAIKVLPNSLARDPERLARFEREAKVLASLNHPNIATIYSLEESPEGKAIAMELVEGETLKSPLPLDAALHYAKQIADALEAAHEKGVTHRDLKPANIMVTPAGLVKVLDFGLAAVSRPATGTGEDSPTLTMGMTDAGVIMGTAAYMAPEQAVGSPVDRRADIWSFGVVLWQMLTGKPLFTGDTTAHILASVIKDPIDSALLPATIPAPIRDLLNRCLDRDVKTRLQVISEARIAIQRYIANPTPESPAIAPIIVPVRASKLPWIATALATLAALALAYVAYQHSTEPPPRLARFSFAPGEKGSLLPLVPPAVSPDGRHIVYAASTDGKNALWMRDIDSPTPRKLTDFTGGHPHPFWSPDSRFLAFFDDAKLKKLDVSGGPAIVLCDVAQGRGGSWSGNDVILFSNNTTTLFRVSAAGGTPTPITDVKDTPGETHRYPWFLPDGHHFLYTVRNPDPNKAGIYFADLDAKGRTQISNAASNAVYVAPGFLLFVRDQTLISLPFDAAKGQASGDAVPVAEQVGYDQPNYVGLYSASPQNGVLAYTASAGGGAAQITWFDHSGKSLGTVGTPGLIERASLSPDEATVVENRGDGGTGNNDLWLHDLARGTASRLTFAGNNRFPVRSPDGARIAFYRQRDGKAAIVVKAANGTGQEEVISDGPSQHPMDWSRDGRYVLSETFNPKTQTDIWVSPQFGDKKPFPFLQSEFREDAAKLSPDGRWLAYYSDESKRNEVYVVSFPAPGGKWQISTDGGSTPVWSRDGRELYFISAANQMMAVPVKPAGTKLEAGLPKPLFEVRLSSADSNFDVSKDGRFLIPTVGRETSSAPVDVILNWQAGLKK